MRIQHFRLSNCHQTGLSYKFRDSYMCGRDPLSMQLPKFAVEVSLGVAQKTSMLSNRSEFAQIVPFPQPILNNRSTKALKSRATYSSFANQLHELFAH